MSVTITNHVPFASFNIPIGSLYGIITYIYHKHQPNVGKYTIHGSYGIVTLAAWNIV